MRTLRWVLIRHAWAASWATLLLALYLVLEVT
jgi:hypothetical protein